MKKIKLIGCFIGAALASMAKAFIGAFTFKAKAKPAANMPTLKEMLETGHVVTVQVIDVIGIGTGTPNGGGVFQNAATSPVKANTATLGATITGKAKTWFDIAGQIEHAIKKANGYFAKTGANGHFTGNGVAAIGA